MCVSPSPVSIWVLQWSQCFKIRVAQHWGWRGHISVRRKVWGLNLRNFPENSRETVSGLTICDEYCSSTRGEAINTRIMRKRKDWSDYENFITHARWQKKPSNKVTNHDVPLLSNMEMDSPQFNVIRLIAVYFSPLPAKINKYFCEYRVLQKVRLFTNTNFASKFSS